ncbi:MAG: DivIVA domain-containing protein [Thermoanaerobacterales bacterium]|nr:DivIVA domain-containing protein [Thermoanaerobacterales bacterium]
MEFTPIEIQKKEFKKSFRGYNEDEVRDYLYQVSQSFESTYKENQELKEQIAMLNDDLKHYRDMESTLKNAIVMAEKTAEDVRKNAQKERDVIIKDAMLKAKELVEKSKQKCRLFNEQSEELRKQFLLFKMRFVNFLESQLDFVNSHELGLCCDEAEIDVAVNEAAASVDNVEMSDIDVSSKENDYNDETNSED